MRWQYAAAVLNVWRRFANLLRSPKPAAYAKLDAATERLKQLGRRSVSITPRLTLSQVRRALYVKHNEPRHIRLSRPIFISLDFEYNPTTLRPTQMGVAVLDIEMCNSNSDLSKHIQFAHYDVRTKKPSCFEFGKPRQIKEVVAGHILDRILLDPKELSLADRLSAPMMDSRRPVILVGHSLLNDLAVARKLGAKLPNVIGRFDTSLVAEVGTPTPSLKLLAIALGLSEEMPRARWHRAGNDAAFTLLAMIELAEQELRTPRVVAPEVARWRKVLESKAIALSALQSGTKPLSWKSVKRQWTDGARAHLQKALASK